MRRDINRLRIINDRCRHINDTRCRCEDNLRRSTRRGSVCGIRDGVICRMAINRMSDDSEHGNSGEDFPHCRPFAVTRFGGLQACACES